MNNPSYYCMQEDGGSPISNYIVEKKDARTGRWEPCSKFVRGPSYEVMNLEENHEYQFRVMAENEHGVSEPIEMEKPIIAKYPLSKCLSPFPTFLIQFILNIFRILFILNIFLIQSILKIFLIQSILKILLILCSLFSYFYCQL